MYLKFEFVFWGAVLHLTQNKPGCHRNWHADHFSLMCNFTTCKAAWVYFFFTMGPHLNMLLSTVSQALLERPDSIFQQHFSSQPVIDLGPFTFLDCAKQPSYRCLICVSGRSWFLLSSTVYFRNSKHSVDTQFLRDYGNFRSTFFHCGENNLFWISSSFHHKVVLIQLVLELFPKGFRKHKYASLLQKKFMALSKVPKPVNPVRRIVAVLSLWRKGRFPTAASSPPDLQPTPDLFGRAASHVISMEMSIGLGNIKGGWPCII